MNSNLKNCDDIAPFHALACVATMSIRIPTPGTGGYIHPDNRNPVRSCSERYGLLAAGIGSANVRPPLADILYTFRLHL